MMKISSKDRRLTGVFCAPPPLNHIFFHTLEEAYEDRNQIDKLKLSMIEEGFLKNYPIIAVNQGDTLGIINGRHRLLAAQELGIDVWVIVISQEQWTKGLKVTGDEEELIYWYELDLVEQDVRKLANLERSHVW